jgi:hypothetical protein
MILAECVVIAGRLCLLHTDIDAVMDAKVPSRWQKASNA